MTDPEETQKSVAQGNATAQAVAFPWATDFCVSHDFIIAVAVRLGEVLRTNNFARYRPENTGTPQENRSKKASKTNESNQTSQLSK